MKNNAYFYVWPSQSKMHKLTPHVEKPPPKSHVKKRSSDLIWHHIITHHLIWKLQRYIHMCEGVKGVFLSALTNFYSFVWPVLTWESLHQLDRSFDYLWRLKIIEIRWPSWTKIFAIVFSSLTCVDHRFDWGFGQEFQRLLWLWFWLNFGPPFWDASGWNLAPSVVLSLWQTNSNIWSTLEFWSLLWNLWSFVP